jgi:biopolymer transport protein ExbB
MDTQWGLAHFWQQGDGVTRSVALVLLAMSVASWVVIIVKATQLRRHHRQARACEGFWHSRDFDEGLAKLGPADDSPFHQLAAQGREASRHTLHFDGDAPRPEADPAERDEWISRTLRNAIDDSAARLQSGLAVLASVGSTAPFVGLFGTVWGIYHALLVIGASGQATIDKVAGPIGESLIMTALGLAVAIPAVLGYNALVRGNKGLLHKLRRFAHDLHAYLVTGARVGERAGRLAAVSP